MTVREDKKALRASVLKYRAALDEQYCNHADTAMLHHLLQLPEYSLAQTIFCYIGMTHEIDTRPLIERAWQDGKTVCVPLCVSKGIMEAHSISSWDDVKIGFYHLEEPNPKSPLIQPQNIDLGVIPCVTCNRHGHRLGYGGGYYDRFLQQVHFPKVILCRKQSMQDNIPLEPHDIIMDIIISEEQDWRVSI